VLCSLLWRRLSWSKSIVPKLSAVELEQVIKLVGRSPRVYPPDTLDTLKQRRTSTSPQPPSVSGPGDLAIKEPAGRTAAARGRDTRLPPRLGAGGHSPQSINGSGSPQAALTAYRTREHLEGHEVEKAVWIILTSGLVEHGAPSISQGAVKGSNFRFLMNLEWPS